MLHASLFDTLRFACCGGAIPPSAFVGDAGIGDQRFAAGWGRGGRGLSIVLAGRWLSIVRGSLSDANGNEAEGNWYKGMA